MSSNNDDNGENDGCGCNKNKRPPNYPVFTNPLDMERFFNQQMNEIIKSFAMHNTGCKEIPKLNELHDLQLCVFMNDDYRTVASINRCL